MERVFDVLFKRFNKLYVPSRFLYSDDVRMVLKECCILHNMLVEEHREWFLDDGVGNVRTK